MTKSNLPLNNDFWNQKKPNEEFKTLPCCGQKVKAEKKVFGDTLGIGLYCFDCGNYFFAKGKTVENTFFKMQDKIQSGLFNQIFNKHKT